VPNFIEIVRTAAEICKFQYYASLAWKCLFTPLLGVFKAHFPQMMSLIILTPKRTIIIIIIIVAWSRTVAPLRDLWQPQQTIALTGGFGLLPSFVSTASRSAAFAGTAGSSRAMWPKMDRRWRLRYWLIVVSPVDSRTDMFVTWSDHGLSLCWTTSFEP